MKINVMQLIIGIFGVAVAWSSIFEQNYTNQLLLLVLGGSLVIMSNQWGGIGK